MSVTLKSDVSFDAQCRSIERENFFFLIISTGGQIENSEISREEENTIARLLFLWDLCPFTEALEIEHVTVPQPETEKGTVHLVKQILDKKGRGREQIYKELCTMGFENIAKMVQYYAYSMVVPKK